MITHLAQCWLCKHETPLNSLPAIHTEVCDMVRNPVQEVTDAMWARGRSGSPWGFLARLLILIGEPQVSARGPVSETR